MGTAHLICGSTGAGKTTYAMKIAEAGGSVRFTIDEWMAALFFPDAPEPLSFQWALERVIRCENQIWPKEFMISKQLVKRRLTVDPSVLKDDAIEPAGFLTE